MKERRREREVGLTNYSATETEQEHERPRYEQQQVSLDNGYVLGETLLFSEGIVHYVSCNSSVQSRHSSYLSSVCGMTSLCICTLILVLFIYRTGLTNSTYSPSISISKQPFASS